jgi:hypothetical protein
MTNIFFQITDFVGANTFTGHFDFVELSEIVGPGSSGSVMSYNGPVKAHPDGTGLVTFTNVFPNSYHVTVHHVTHLGRILNREFDILVPSVSGTYNGKDLEINVDPQPQVDSRYVLKNAVDPYFVAGTGVTLSSSFTGSIERLTINAAAGGLTSGSTYPITASYAVTASYAMNGGTGGGSSLGTGSTYPFTASWAKNAITASVMKPVDTFWPSDDLIFDGSKWYNQTTFPGTPVMQLYGGSSAGNPKLALNAQLDVSANAAGAIPLLVLEDNQANVNSYNVIEYYSGSGHTLKLWVDRDGLLHATASTATSASYAKTASLATGVANSITATGWNFFLPTVLDQLQLAGTNDTVAIENDDADGINFLLAAGSVIVNFNQNGIVSAATFSGSFNGPHSGSHFGTSSNAVSASYALSCSYALNAGGAGTLGTGSTYPFTASFAVTSSRAISSVSASYALSASYAPGTAGTLGTGSTYPFTSSWSNTSSVSISSSYALSASYAPSTGGGGLATGSTYPITASWSTNSLTASFIASASYALSSSRAASSDQVFVSATTNPSYHNIPLVLGNTSYQSCFVDSSSFLGYNPPAGSLKATTMTASFFQGTVTGSLIGTASFAVSASYAPGTPGTLGTGSTYPFTSSWSNTSSVATSASFATTASFVTSASYALSSSYTLTSSFAITASSLTPYRNYTTLTTASNQRVNTCSFNSNTPEYFLTTNVGGTTYTMTSSGAPTSGQYAEFVITINNVATGTTGSAFSWPAAYNFGQGGTPTFITASSIAKVYVQCFDGNLYPCRISF